MLSVPGMSGSGSGVRYLTHGDDRTGTRAQVWDVADARGRILATRLSIAHLRARLNHGLLATAALVARAGDDAWVPIQTVLQETLWYLSRDGVVVGPVETDRVQRGILAGRVPGDSLVCRAGDHRWTRLDDLPEFAGCIAEAMFDDEPTQAFDVWGSVSGWA